MKNKTVKLIAVLAALGWQAAFCAGIGLEPEQFPWPDPADGSVLVVPATDGSDWDRAAEISTFYRGSDGKPAELDASVRVLLAGEELRLRFSLPAAAAATAPRKCFLSDELMLLGAGPCLTVALDPGHGHGVYYQFVTDPAGRRQDLRVFDESWNSHWEVNLDDSAGRWAGEITIPVADIFQAPAGGEFWGFNLVIYGLMDDALSSTPLVLNLTDAEGFGHLLFRGSSDDKAIAVAKATLPEFHKKARTEKLAANRALCGPELVEIGGELKGLAVQGVYSLSGGRKLTCLGLDNQPVVRSRYPFFYERYDNPELARLRNTFNLDEAVEQGRNEFEKLLMLNEWLVKHVTFGSPAPIRPQAFHVLNHGFNGQTFNCTYLSFTLAQMYVSLGWTARKITSVGHGTLDVWSNYWSKWIQIDPSRNSYYRLRGAAVPLNSNEIRRELWRNGGVDMEMVYGTEQRAEGVTIETRDRDGLLRYRQDGYQWIAYKTRNNFLEVPYAYWNFRYLIIDDEYSRGKRWPGRSESDVDPRERMALRTDRVGDIFWTLNQAYIHLYDDGGGNLIVRLETVTPNFDKFQVSLNHGEWRDSETVFGWELHPGQNILQARSVNKFGMAGSEYKVVLLVE